MANWRKKKSIIRKSPQNVYVGHWNLTTDILHNLRNAETIPFSLSFLSQTFTFILRLLSLKISCLFLAESSHYIVKSSRYIPRDRSHMCNTEINLNSGTVMAKEILTIRTPDAWAKHFLVYCFIASGRPIIYVCGHTFILCHFVYI